MVMGASSEGPKYLFELHTQLNNQEKQEENEHVKRTKCLKLSYFQTPHFSHLLFVLNDLNGNFQKIKLTPYIDMVMDMPVF
jgi:hypothetical protein